MMKSKWIQAAYIAISMLWLYRLSHAKAPEADGVPAEVAWVCVHGGFSDMAHYSFHCGVGETKPPPRVDRRCVGYIVNDEGAVIRKIDELAEVRQLTPWVLCANPNSESGGELPFTLYNAKTVMHLQPEVQPEAISDLVIALKQKSSSSHDSEVIGYVDRDLVFHESITGIIGSDIEEGKLVGHVAQLDLPIIRLDDERGVRVLYLDGSMSIEVDGLSRLSERQLKMHSGWVVTRIDRDRSVLYRLAGEHTTVEIDTRSRVLGNELYVVYRPLGSDLYIVCDHSGRQLAELPKHWLPSLVTEANVLLLDIAEPTETSRERQSREYRRDNAANRAYRIIPSDDGVVLELVPFELDGTFDEFLIVDRTDQVWCRHKQSHLITVLDAKLNPIIVFQSFSFDFHQFRNGATIYQDTSDTDTVQIYSVHGELLEQIDFQPFPYAQQRLNLDD